MQSAMAERRDDDEPAATERGEARAVLTAMQQRIWFMEAMLPGCSSYQLCWARRLSGALNLAALQHALDALVARHGALRSQIHVDAEQRMAQFVPAPRPAALAPLHDLSALAPIERSRELDRRLAEIARQPQALSSGPLFGCWLFRVGEDQHLLLFKVHHIVCDGWSMGVIVRDLGQLYAAQLSGTPAQLPTLALSYTEFAERQNVWSASELARPSVRYWAQRLRDAAEPLALPTDSARPRHPSDMAHCVPISLATGASEQLRELGAACGATLFMTLLGAYFAFLYKSSGQTELVVGVPVHGRRDLPDCQELVGLFANIMPVHMTLQADESFQQLLARLAQTLREDLRHSNAPIEQVVGELRTPRDPSRSTLYQAFFGFQDLRDQASRWGDIALEMQALPVSGIAEDIACRITQTSAGLNGNIACRADLFSQASTASLAERYQRLLQRIAEAPELTLGELSRCSDIEQQRLREWNDTQQAYDNRATVHATISARSLSCADAPALQQGSDGLSYAQLEARSNQLAHALRARGVRRGALVGLCVARSLNMVVAQLAVLKAGAAYVPLDPAYPPQRLSFMAEDAQLAWLITESALQHTLPWPRTQSLWLDADAVELAREPAHALPVSVALDASGADPAYVIYTSGSTGQPKGVVVQHAAVVNFLASMAREPGLRSSDRVLAVTTLSFDIAVLELLLPLSLGAQVVLASREQASDGQALRALLEASSATLMQATPATWRMLIDAGWRGHAGFKALIGGEGLPSDLAAQLLERCGELWNMYGPTETTVWSTCCQVEQLERGISIGRPIDNTQVHILNERQQLCPIGVPGEIYIGGEGVTLGYLHRAQLTAERFVNDPFSTQPGARLYRTGDRGRWRPDGWLEHLGRLDFQVKLRGHRIELGEIESNLASHPQVARSLVVVREDRPGDPRLVAYVVGRDGTPSASSLREHLRASQPEYAMPQHYVPLAEIPLLPNGKIDRHALPAPGDDAQLRDAPFEAPRSETESLMAHIWQQLLGVSRVSVNDNFFHLGGHSMLAVRLVAQVQARFGRALPLVALLENGSVRQLSAWLDRPAPHDSLVRLRAGGPKPPLFLVHDGIGETLLYRNLACALNADHAVYGLQPHAGEGCALLHTRICEMAAYHIAKIRSVQAHGPYLLGGLCAGGVIAFEIARQLQAQGEAIAMLALIDAADPDTEQRRGRTARRRLQRFVGTFKSSTPTPALKRLAGAVPKAARKLWNLLAYETDRFVSQRVLAVKLGWLRHALDHGRTPPVFSSSLSVAQIYRYALVDENPRAPLHGDVLLFRATQDQGADDDEPYIEIFADPLFGWSRHVTGKVIAIDVPGGHTSLLQEPHVQVLAQRMQACIGAGLAQAEPSAAPDSAARSRAAEPSL